MPKACLKQTHGAETKGKNHPAVFRDREQALFRFRKTTGEKKKEKKLSEYLRVLSRQAPRISCELS